MKSSVTFNPVLSALFKKYILDTTGFVGQLLAPAFFSAEQAANYYVFDAVNYLNLPTLQQRAPGTSFQRSTMALSGDSYVCKNYGHETPVADETRKKYANAFDADRAAVERNALIILASHEQRVHDLVTGAPVTTSTPTFSWGNYESTNSDPVGDVASARELVRLQCGIRPNTLTLSETVFQRLRFHPQIRKNYYSNSDGVVTREMLRAIFEVEKLNVASAVQNAAAEGQGLNPADLWGEDVILSVTNSSQNLEVPNAFRTFIWQAGGGDVGSRVESYRADESDSDIHRSKHWTDEKLTGPEMAYRLSNVLFS